TLRILLTLFRRRKQLSNGNGAFAVSIAATTSATWLVVFCYLGGLCLLCVLRARLSGIIAAGVPPHSLEGTGVKFLGLIAGSFLGLCRRLFFCWLHRLRVSLCRSSACRCHLCFCLATSASRAAVVSLLRRLIGVFAIHLIDEFGQWIVIAGISRSMTASPRNRISRRLAAGRLRKFHDWCFWLSIYICAIAGDIARIIRLCSFCARFNFHDATCLCLQGSWYIGTFAAREFLKLLTNRCQLGSNFSQHVHVHVWRVF